MKLALLALLVPTLAVAQPTKAPASKKDRAAKSVNTRALPTVGSKPAKLVNLQNSWTDEWLSIADGETVDEVTAGRFLRDHYTNSPTKMEKRLLEIVVSAAKNFRSDTAIVVSAFRHPKYNLILRKKGHQVARDSQHTHGNAVDFYIPRIATLQLHAWAKAQAIGGVGLYLSSGFIHMDTGKVRYWNGE